MYSIRPIQPQDNAQIAKIIREVSVEFGLAAESGFAVGDSILDNLYEVYQQPNAAYWVIVDEQDQVFGGGGIAPMGPNVGGITPVAGAENLGGGSGGGVGSAAKDMARRTAAGAGGPAGMGQMGSEGGE